MKNIILTLLMGLLLVGCTNVTVDPISITDLREFSIDEGLHIGNLSVKRGSLQ